MTDNSIDSGVWSLENSKKVDKEQSIEDGIIQHSETDNLLLNSQMTTSIISEIPSEDIQSQIKERASSETEKLLSEQKEIPLITEDISTIDPGNDEKMRMKEDVTEDSYNILMLGETGVGKTTFICAITNYLKYSSMEEALEKGPLVPLDISFISTLNLQSFAVRIAANLDGGERYSSNECGQEGQSKTQNPMSHKIQCLWNQLIETLNLIDTPGVMDTSGERQDELNFSKIREILQQTEQLHGVLILLKPNVSRLTLNFRRALDKIFTIIKNVPAENILFCFTNTQSFRYRPGDTIVPLNELLTDLEKRKGIAVKADRFNIFCFDSCCFRFMCEVMADTSGTVLNTPYKPSQYDWEMNVKSLKELMDKIRELSPFQIKFASEEDLMDYEEETEKLVDETKRLGMESVLAKNDLNSIKLQLEEIENKKKILEEKQYYKEVVIDHKRLVCTNSKCPYPVHSEYSSIDKPQHICQENYVVPIYLSNNDQFHNFLRWILGRERYTRSNNFFTYFKDNKWCCISNCYFLINFLFNFFGSCAVCLGRCWCCCFKLFGSKRNNCTICRCALSHHKIVNMELVPVEINEAKRDELASLDSDAEAKKEEIRKLEEKLKEIVQIIGIVLNLAAEFTATFAAFDHFDSKIEEVLQNKLAKSNQSCDYDLSTELQKIKSQYKTQIQTITEEIRSGWRKPLESKELKTRRDSLNRLTIGRAQLRQ